MSSEHAAERLRTARVQWTATIVAERDEARAEVGRLRDALRPFALLYERYENVHDLGADEVVVPYVALYQAAKALEGVDAR